MAGKTKNTSTGWGLSHLMDVRSAVDESMEAFNDLEKPKTALEIGRKMRCAGTLTRVIVLVDRHTRPETVSGEASEQGDDGDRDDPEEMRRLHAEIRDRLERTRRNMVAGGPGGGQNAGGPGADHGRFACAA